MSAARMLWESGFGDWEPWTMICPDTPNEHLYGRLSSGILIRRAQTAHGGIIVDH